MHEALQSVVGVITAIIGLAIFSVLASHTSLITATTSGVATDIKAATAPAMGTSSFAMGDITAPSFTMA